ncbi:MAG: putative sulfate exporter family transporter [Bacteroidetes bacterium]|nr:putative sulfate exporter family transporter [Bacteroidota bacterium]
MSTANKPEVPEQPNSTKETLTKIIFLVAAAACLTPYIDAPVALLMGLVLALTIGHPYMHLNKKATNWLLKSSVVGLGFGMNIQTAMQAGKQGILFTIVSILSTLLIGWLLGRLLKIDKKTSHLVASGTAICGGSAIAAVGPVIDADDKSMSVSLGIVFILNSIALLLFPYLGHLLNLSQQQFGLWSAIAIHDTSSVVGAASKYGDEALRIATTVKLARALWIIPVALVSAFMFKAKSRKINIPWFIGLYILAMVIYTYVPFVQEYGHYVVVLAKKGLTLTLFLIGAGLSKKVIQSVGFKPFLQGIILWLLISVTALWAVMHLI